MNSRRKTRIIFVTKIDLNVKTCSKVLYSFQTAESTCPWYNSLAILLMFLYLRFVYQEALVVRFPKFPISLVPEVTSYECRFDSKL